MAKKHASPCPCGGVDYAVCCGRYIGHGGGQNSAQGGEQLVPAPSPVALMRSRYTAYTLKNEDYVRATWYPRTLPDGPLIQRDEEVKWVGLEVLKYDEAGDQGSVEFIARYKIGGRAYKMHEASRFVREEGRWYYLDGQHR